MTEITQADRDATNDALRNALMQIGSMHEAFARHRLAERAKIVAWLRSVDDLDERWALQNSHWYADEIEAGEHETFTHPDNV